MLVEAAHRPLEKVVTAGATRESHSGKLVEVCQRRQIDIRVRRFETARWLRRLAEWCDPKRELRVTA